MRLASTWLALPMAALTCAQALAQIAPPPGPAAPATPEWTPPKPSTTLPPTPAAKYIQQQNAARQPLPALPYESLVKRDAAGKVIRLKEPVQIAALRNNPSIDEVTRKRLVGVLAHRQATVDRLAIENLDVIDKVEAGAIDKIDPSDSKHFGREVTAITKPLRPPNNELNVDLRTSGQISVEQSRWSEKLYQEYNHEVGNEIAAANTPEVKGKQKYTEYQRIEETMMAYPRMLVEASRNLDKILPQLNLPADTVAKIDPTLKKLSSDAADDAKREELMRQWAKNLTLQQRQDLLRKTVALRPPLPAMEPPPVRPPAPGRPGAAPAEAPPETPPETPITPEPRK